MFAPKIWPNGQRSLTEHTHAKQHVGGGGAVGDREVSVALVRKGSPIPGRGRLTRRQMVYHTALCKDWSLEDPAGEEPRGGTPEPAWGGGLSQVRERTSPRQREASMEVGLVQGESA